MSFAERCGVQTPERLAAIDQLSHLIGATGVQQVRFSWCDLHGMLRGKTLMVNAALNALNTGLGMVSTLMLKDTSDRTAYPVFDAGGTADLPGFEAASNLLLLADPQSYQELPWARQTGWVQCQPWFQNATPVGLDTRRVLQKALHALQSRGFGLRCGLEIEFHIYRLHPDGDGKQIGIGGPLDPNLAAWPGLAPTVSMVHPGYQLLSENLGDQCEEPLAIVRDTALALGLPLLSLEIELGPSQVEAVFDVTDALVAADNMVLFRSAVTQALRRAGYLATFMCRPPFEQIMSSGWHLHQSLVDLATGRNAFMRVATAFGATPQVTAPANATLSRSDAQFTLSPVGEHYLAGLLAHAPGMAALAVPTINGFERFRPNALAPQAIVWGLDNRGAMLRVIGNVFGQAGDPATRIENRIGEPAANPYLYIASQIYAGLDGLQRQLKAPQASAAPYEQGSANLPQLPSALGDALNALKQDTALVQGMGIEFVNYYTHVKSFEIKRWQAASDKPEWQRREYFGRI